MPTNRPARNRDLEDLREDVDNLKRDVSILNETTYPVANWIKERIEAGDLITRDELDLMFQEALEEHDVNPDETRKAIDALWVAVEALQAHERYLRPRPTPTPKDWKEHPNVDLLRTSDS